MALIGAPASACSCDYPDIGFLAEGSIEVPVNARGLLWSGVLQPFSGFVEFPPEENFRIEELIAEEWVSLPVRMNFLQDPSGVSDSPYSTLVVGPEGGLSALRNYRFVYFAREERPLHSALRSAASDSHVVHVVVSAEEFSSDLSVQRIDGAFSGKLRVAVDSSCSWEYDARWVDIEQILPPELEKWKDSFVYSATSGGRYWHPRASICGMVPPGRSWRGANRERVYHLVDPRSGAANEPGLAMDAPGVSFFVRLPGTNRLHSVSVLFSFEAAE